MMIEDQENHSSCILTDFNLPLHEFRHSKIISIALEKQVKRILDLGCSEGTFLQLLSRSPHPHLLVGVDIDQSCLVESVSNTLPEPIQSSIQFQREVDLKLEIYQGNLLQEYPELKQMNFDMITFIEVVEHLHLHQISAANHNIFGYLRPQWVIVTTPNKEFNCHFDHPESLRHWDHKFEWDRQQFSLYCQGIADKYHYNYQIEGIGEHVTDKSKGACTQMAIFSLCDEKIPLSQAQALEKASEDEGNSIPLKLKEKYNIKCWKSNLNSIMLNIFYRALGNDKEGTFESVLEEISKSKLSECMQAPLSVAFVQEQITNYSDLFSWNESKYQILFTESSDEEESYPQVKCSSSAMLSEEEEYEAFGFKLE